MAKRQTNVQLVTRIMEWSPTGALSQAFVIEAVRRYAKQCAEADAEALDTAYLNGEAWKRTAQFALKEINAHFDAM